MTKKQKIEAIRDMAKIHHNIRIDFNKMPKCTNEELDYLEIAGMLVEDFANNWKYEEINDKGNRNLCGCDNNTR